MSIPKHVAIVMDGNGRWAKQRGRSRVFGHVRGSRRVRDIVEAANRMHVKVLSLYAFSTENWLRPESERKILWQLLKKYILRDTVQLEKQNIRLKVIGELERLDEDVRFVLDSAIQRLSPNTGLQLNIALSYGSRREIINGVRRFSEDCVSGLQQPHAITEALMENYLWTHELGSFANVDLLIRTSGEYRISNFLLWQAAYAELVFVEACWPDFTADQFALAIQEYARRERRFGSLRV